jgi:hypothetical protein
MANAWSDLVSLCLFEAAVRARSCPYLWSANVLPGPPNTTCLKPALGIDPLIPSRFDPLLDLEYGWNGVVEGFVALGLSVNDVRRQHLDVPIAAETP